jgi:hypothetical protein
MSMPLQNYTMKAIERVFGEPERPINPPDEPVLNIDVAVKRLEKSLTAQKTSEYWDDFALLFKDEISDEELDQLLVAIAENDQPELMLIMQKIHKRAIRATAQIFLGQLGGVA